MGIMGKKNKIINEELSGIKLDRFKNILRGRFNIKHVEEILHVVKGKTVYEVRINEFKSFRLDVHETTGEKSRIFHRRRAFYQNLVQENDVHIPKIIGFCEVSNIIYKLSSWIKGQRIGYVWNNPLMFRKAGIEVAKINSIKDPNSNKFLGYNDFTKPNAIWTLGGEVYLIDVVVEPKRDVDFNVVKILLKNIEDKKRIRWFLNGYAQIRNISNIKKQIVERQYKW